MVGLKSIQETILGRGVESLPRTKKCDGEQAKKEVLHRTMSVCHLRHLRIVLRIIFGQRFETARYLATLMSTEWFARLRQHIRRGGNAVSAAS
jgi:hypothetical protein